MRAFRSALFFLCCLILSGAGTALAANARGTPKTVAWTTLEKGLDIARIPFTFTLPAPFSFPATTDDAPGSGSQPDSGPGAAPASTGSTPGSMPSSAPSSAEEETHTVSVTAVASIVRIDPARFSFSLYMASEKGRKTMAQVCKDENFAAAINAGMFLPDKVTNTGYLRQGTHVNNPHIAKNFGSFFVAGPLKPGLVQARLMDKGTHDWQKALSEYSLVMQNYRMTTPKGRIIWKQAERLHSIAALSQDAKGNILFIFCPDPVPASDFMAAILASPIYAHSVMYLEGGSEAALVINAGGVSEMQTGRHISGLWSGGAKLEIPNVLGIVRRAK